MTVSSGQFLKKEFMYYNIFLYFSGDRRR